MSEIKVKTIEFVNPKDLKPHPRNRNKHTKAQIERLAKIIQRSGMREPINVSKRAGYIVTGHCTTLACIEAGLEKVPVMYQDYETEKDEVLHMNADNEMARWASLEEDLLRDDVLELGLEDDLEFLGLEKDFDLKNTEIFNNENIYTNKVKIPIYEITGNKPKLNELIDLTKTKELINEIKKSNISSDEKKILLHAAERHTVFNYSKIAEYYAHSDKEMQNLMENSALVIIDFNKAIEKGFVKLTKDLADLYDFENNEG